VTKSDAIREVVKNNYCLPNEEIKREVRRQYGLEVESNLIAGVIGPEKQRLRTLTYSGELKRQAKNLIINAGSFKQAKKLLYLVAGGM
jgi:hypothetical protein